MNVRISRTVLTRVLERACRSRVSNVRTSNARNERACVYVREMSNVRDLTRVSLARETCARTTRALLTRVKDLSRVTRAY